MMSESGPENKQNTWWCKTDRTRPSPGIPLRVTKGETTCRTDKPSPGTPHGADYTEDGQASLLLTPSRGSQETGRYKTWTLDSGMDYGLVYGLNFGLNFGLDSRTYKLTSHFQAFPPSST